MCRIRVFEESCVKLLEDGEIRGPAHLYTGQEAIAAGVCAALHLDDVIFGGHRSHGHYLAKGGDLAAMMAELFGKSTGCSKGRGGSQHLFAPQVGLLGTVPLVGATISLAVGAGLAFKLRKEPRVSVAFFGDGAAEEGTLHESMNLAATHRLPALFVCENNFFASHMSLLERRARDNLSQLAAAHGMPGVSVDGNDVTAVLTAARDAVARARQGEGPSFIEARTYRWRGHVGPRMDLDVGVQRSGDAYLWMKCDPIERLRRVLIERAIAPEALGEICSAAEREVEEAIAFARKSPVPLLDELLEHVYAKGAH